MARGDSKAAKQAVAKGTVAKGTVAKGTVADQTAANHVTANHVTANHVTAKNMTANDRARLLGAAEPFSRLGRRAVKALAASAKTVEHVPGHLVVEEGGTPLGFHLITEGEAVVEVAGKERRRLGPGESFGFISVIDGKPRSASVRTVTALRTLFISPWVFRPMLASEPTIAQDLLPALCAMLRDAERAD